MRVRFFLPLLLGFAFLVTSDGAAQLKEANSFLTIVGSGSGDKGYPLGVTPDGAAHVNPKALVKDLDSVTSFPGHTSNVTTTQVSCSTTTALLIAANTNRLRVDVSLFTASVNVYFCRAATCTTGTAFMVLAAAAGQPYGDPNYTGPLSCIMATGSGTVAVSELILTP